MARVPVVRSDGASSISTKVTSGRALMRAGARFSITARKDRADTAAMSRNPRRRMDHDRVPNRCVRRASWTMNFRRRGRDGFHRRHFPPAGRARSTDAEADHRRT